VVGDRYVVAGPNGDEGTKIGCTMFDQYGGGAVIVSQAIRPTGVPVKPVFLVGNDDLGDRAIEELGKELPDREFARGYPTTRRSVIMLGGRCFTERPRLGIDALPPALRRLVSTCEITVVAPMAAEDLDFVHDTLEAAPQSVLMLSADQLRNPITAYQLMRAASITVLNDAEAHKLTGERHPKAAIEACLARGCSGMVVTFRDGALAWIDAQWHATSAVQIPCIRQPVGAGDEFTGVLVAAKAAGRSMSEALRLGQAAAARHVGGMNRLTLDELDKWCVGMPRATGVPQPVTVPPQPLRLGRAISVGTGVGLAAAFLIGLYL
jgi:sugar/nucleoside kinase (ribokinase family)